jgi:hypothetical protein
VVLELIGFHLAHFTAAVERVTLRVAQSAVELAAVAEQTLLAQVQRALSIQAAAVEELRAQAVQAAQEDQESYYSVTQILLQLPLVRVLQDQLQHLAATKLQRLLLAQGM